VAAVKASGTLLIVAGVWVLCQLFAGNALERLGVVAGGGEQGPGGAAPPGVVPTPSPDRAKPTPRGRTQPAPSPGTHP